MNITGKNKAAILAALYNASKPLGLGHMHYDPTPMTEEDVEQLILHALAFGDVRHLHKEAGDHAALIGIG